MVDKEIRKGVVTEERKKKEITTSPVRITIPRTQAIAEAEETEAEVATGKKIPIEMATKEVAIEDEVVEAEDEAVMTKEGKLSNILEIKTMLLIRRK